jgi:outer membrane protein assembly factor BamB
VAQRLTTICCSAFALLCSVYSGACVRVNAAGDLAVTSADTVAPLSVFPLRTIWTLPLNRALGEAPPAYDGARGFFSIAGGQIVAYDLEHGSQLWIADAATNLQPAAGDGLLFITTPDGIVALQQTDGTERWRLPMTAAAIPVPLVWDNGWLIAATESGQILALRAADGRTVWTRDLGAPLHARPALAADRVYLPVANGRVVALNVVDGAVLWERRLGDMPNEILALADRLYVGSDDKYFYCISDKGVVLWRFRTGAAIVEKPVFDDRRVYFVSRDNILRGMNRRSGSQDWRHSLPFRVRNGPVVVGSVVGVGGITQPTLHTFQVLNGQPSTDITAPAAIVAAPHVTRWNASPSPEIFVVCQDLDKGATIIRMGRSFEPPVIPLTSLPGMLAKMPRAGMPVLPASPAPTP